MQINLISDNTKEYIKQNNFANFGRNLRLNLNLTNQIARIINKRNKTIKTKQNNKKDLK